MSDRAPTNSADPAAAAPPVEPTQAEIDEWAAQERARREAWLQGPTEEERAAYAKRLQNRKLADAFDESEHRLEASVQPGPAVRSGGPARRAEGAAALFYRWSRRTVRRACSRPDGSGRRRRRCRAVAAASRWMRTPTDPAGRTATAATGLAAAGRPPHEDTVQAPPSGRSRPGRASSACSSLRRCGLPGADRRPGPVRMRLAFEQLGGAWVKLGQMLALRYDLLPVAYCDELFGLLNQVAPFGYDQISGIIRQELGAAPEVVFATFEPASFAAASIGQVHRAVLHNGDPVAVKVQRPRIRETLQADIDLMYSTDLAARLDPRVRRQREPRGDRRVRALDGRRAGLPGRGATGRSPPRSRGG